MHGESKEQGTKAKHIICKRPETVHTIILTLRKHLPAMLMACPVADDTNVRAMKIFMEKFIVKDNLRREREDFEIMRGLEQKSRYRSVATKHFACHLAHHSP